MNMKVCAYDNYCLTTIRPLLSDLSHKQLQAEMTFKHN